MNCPECIEQMAALAAGSLDEAAAVPVRAHLAACPDCQREYATLTRTLEKLDALPARPPSHRMRAALGGDDDELILGLLGLEGEAAEDIFDGGFVTLFFEAVAVGQGVTARTFVQAHFTDVAGERGLGDIEAAANELAAQLVLADDGRGGDDFADHGMSLRLHVYKQ